MNPPIGLVARAPSAGGVERDVGAVAERDGIRPSMSARSASAVGSDHIDHVGGQRRLRADALGRSVTNDSATSALRPYDLGEAADGGGRIVHGLVRTDRAARGRRGWRRRRWCRAPWRRRGRRAARTPRPTRPGPLAGRRSRSRALGVQDRLGDLAHRGNRPPGVSISIMHRGSRRRHRWPPRSRVRGSRPGKDRRRRRDRSTGTCSADPACASAVNRQRARTAGDERSAIAVTEPADPVRLVVSHEHNLVRHMWRVGSNRA